MNAEGELIAHTDNGPVAYTAPIAFQEDAQGNKQSIAVHYALNAAQNSYGFTLAEYDQNRPLIIDPLIKSSYLGAGGDDYANAVAIHPVTGDVYVAGLTYSNGNIFPGAGGGAQSSGGGGFKPDAFISRFNADLTTLINSSYLGASRYDNATALAIHPTTGDVYVAGITTSSTNTFPGAGGGAQRSNGGTVGPCAEGEMCTNDGSYDAFVSRFSADLATLINSSYLGAEGSDFGTALAIHPATGDVYVAGFTTSSNPAFPGVSGGAQSLSHGNEEAFVSRFSSDLTQLIQSSYFGAAGEDRATALAIHPATGHVYIVGYSTSSSTALPGVSGGAQGSNGGPTGTTDAFVARFSADLTMLVQSSYFGAAGDDYANALAIHPANGDVYIAGYSTSSSTPLPGVSGGAQSSNGGPPGTKDVFVARFNADLGTLIQASYLGGVFGEVAFALAIHPNTGEVYVAGASSGTLPGVRGGAQSSFGGGDDAFISRFSADLSVLIQSSYLGAVEDDVANALAIHPVNGHVYVAGFTRATGNTFPGVNAFPGLPGGAQDYSGGGYDAFVSRVSADLSSTTIEPFAFASQTNVPLAAVRTSKPTLITGIVGAVGIYVDGAASSSYCISSANNCACDISTGFVSAPGLISNNQYVCARHTSASRLNAGTQTIVNVGGVSGKFLVITGTAFVPCNLDMDGDTIISATKEGLVLLRAMLGFSGATTTAGTGITAAQWATARPLINANCGTNFAP